ncbi:MAG: hypothetical protein ACOZAQ_05485 [Pseudomonadota bacterium]
MNQAELMDGAAELARLCPLIPVAPDHQSLLQTVHELWPRLRFRRVLGRGGWYRPGRLHDSQGCVLDGDAVAWIERVWSEYGEDGAALFEAYRDKGLWLSRYEGQTHFLVASCGAGAGQFVQLEVEELREVADRALFDPERPPTELEDVLESPHRYAPPGHGPLGQPLYRFRRVTAIADFLARLRGQRPEAPPACRFVEDWDRSSAAPRPFCEHWAFALSEHLDRFRQPVLSARPVSLDTGPAMIVAHDGLGRAEAIQAFDKQRGYPAAWYFHMVAAAGVPKALSHAVGEDLAQGMEYLPERDATLLADWLDRPYSA